MSFKSINPFQAYIKIHFLPQNYNFIIFCKISFRFVSILKAKKIETIILM